MARRMDRQIIMMLEGLDAVFKEMQVTCACCKYQCPECDIGEIKMLEDMTKITTDHVMCEEQSPEDVINGDYATWLYEEYYDDIMEANDRAFEEERDEWPEY